MDNKDISNADFSSEGAEQTSSSDVASNKARRKVLSVTTTSVVGAGLLNASGVNWTKPVIDSLILPSHAQTSDPDAGGDTGTTMAPDEPTTTEDSGEPTTTEDSGGSTTPEIVTTPPIIIIMTTPPIGSSPPP